MQVKSQNVGKTAQLANEHRKNSSTPKHTHTAASMCNPIHKRAEFGGNDKQNRVAKLKKKEKEEKAEEKEQNTVERQFVKQGATIECNE